MTQDSKSSSSATTTQEFFYTLIREIRKAANRDVSKMKSNEAVTSQLQPEILSYLSFSILQSEPTFDQLCPKKKLTLENVDGELARMVQTVVNQSGGDFATGFMTWVMLLYVNVEKLLKDDNSTGLDKLFQAAAKATDQTVLFTAANARGGWMKAFSALGFADN